MGRMVLPQCPLCAGDQIAELFEVGGRRFYHCVVCAMRYVDPQARLKPEAEKAHYDAHENDPSDPDYRAFLSKLAEPLIDRLEPGASGLDYGCGPGPTLSVMLAERGFSMAVYDPFFVNDAEVLEATYDFIACTETVEHFYQPAEEFDRLARLLRPGGWLAVMTQTADARFGPDWWYLRDPTHVCFYAPETFRWIADAFGWHLAMPAENIALFRRLSAGHNSKS